MGEALAQRHGQQGTPAPLLVLPVPSLPRAGDIAAALRQAGARCAAFVMQPEEIGREVVTTLHRATRQVDDDPWGDCLWGIVTGATAEDALRLACEPKPLCARRLLATTNIAPAAFEHSCCITDWENAPVLTQSGYREVQTQHFAEGEGREQLFAEQLATQRPQLIITSSHATPFNLEMPFGKGLIFPARGRFHSLSAQQMPQFGTALAAAMRGDNAALDALADAPGTTAIEADGEARIWLAAGNCLMGDAHHSAGSMVLTALSAYACRQFVGYTVPSWYGKGGWGTLSLFFDNTENTSLAEAWYLNNQFILAETQALAPALLKAEFHEAEIGPPFLSRMQSQLEQLGLPQEKVRDALGLVHDRDVVAFFGDPAWSATVDNSHSPRPLRVEWQGDTCLALTANRNHKGRAAIWFPRASTGRNATGCDAPGAIFTNDFILFPDLRLDAGETLTVRIHS